MIIQRFFHTDAYCYITISKAIDASQSVLAHILRVKFSGKTPIAEVDLVSSHEVLGIPICQPSSCEPTTHWVY